MALKLKPFRNKYKSKDEGAANNVRILAERRKKRLAKKEQSEFTVESVVAKYKNLVNADTSAYKTFSAFPLSSQTLKGLDECEYTEPTDIQRDSLAFSLTGSDVVGAAKTGSGKTLALVIPLLECLWRAKWSSECGLGALIISPTRELALQTFTCINHIGKYHHFSCALLIGGTDVNYERNRLGRINIIICTPGRLLQHMDENEHLSCDNLQILVVDEADRILDMGFSQQVNAIVANLPKDRQSLLFSATQTKNVKDLSRICAKDPVFISVHEHALNATPDNLSQSYMVCEDHEKVNTVWSFICNHKKMKTLIFVSSCKQARFLTEAFCHLRPGVSVMGLWGTMNQTKRIDVFEKYEKMNAAVMIATDVASRGLDFSNIDWVIQADCPATAEDYIHRVGRTARMNQKGHAILLVTSSQEKGMVSLLMQYNIPVDKLKVDPSAMMDIRQKLQALLAQFSELNQFAQKSVVAYLRSIYLMRCKSIFDVASVDVSALADSYGLISVPRIRFLNKKGIVTMDKGNHGDQIDILKSRISEKESLVGEFQLNEDETNDDLFTIKNSDVFNAINNDVETPCEVKLYCHKKSEKVVTKVKAAKKIINKGVKLNKKKTFTEEGEIVKNEGLPVSLEPTVGLDLQKALVSMKEQDAEDRKRYKEKQKLKKKLVKLKHKEKKRTQDELDLADGGGSGVNSDADLDWLPDPDEVRKRYLEMDDEINSPKRKKVRREVDESVEQQALALLTPF